MYFISAFSEWIIHLYFGAFLAMLQRLINCRFIIIIIIIYYLQV